MTVNGTAWHINQILVTHSYPGNNEPAIDYCVT